MRVARRIVPALVLGLTLALGGVASACPNCKEAVAAQPDGQAERLTKGYFYSILMMLGMPFALVGTGAFVVTRAVKRGALPPM